MTRADMDAVSRTVRFGGAGRDGGRVRSARAAHGPRVPALLASSRRWRICATTSTGGRWPDGRGSRSRCSTRAGRCGPRSKPIERADFRNRLGAGRVRSRSTRSRLPGCCAITGATWSTSPPVRCPRGAPAFGRSYQTPFADRIRNEVGIPTIAVGAISSYDDVNTIMLRRAGRPVRARAPAPLRPALDAARRGRAGVRPGMGAAVSGRIAHAAGRAGPGARGSRADV